MKNIFYFLLLVFIILLFSEITLGLSVYFSSNPKSNFVFPYDTGKNEFNPYLNNLKDLECNYKENCFHKFRLPSIPQNIQNTNPIIIFGCSFAHGNNLMQEQTFGHKLSEYTKRPVYNRARVGSGPGFMYFQTMNKQFYETVPKSDTVIYIIIYDHYRRMLSYKFRPQDEVNQETYKANLKNKKLTPYSYNNILVRFFRTTYIALFFNAYKVKWFIENPKNYDKLADIMLLHIIKSKQELENHWQNNIKFIVIVYNDQEIKNSKLLEKKLSDNGFKVILTSNLTKENLDNNLKYIQQDHPTEAAWDLLTPLIVKEAGL